LAESAPGGAEQAEDSMTDTNSFTAIVLSEDDGKVTSEIQSLPNDALPKGEVTVAVDYSTVNYKDGLIMKGLGRLVRTYPHVPGIDLAGTVEASTSPDYKPGDKVIANGFFLGERHWGAYATRARLPADFLTPLPSALTTRQAMALGTAGYTAMLALMALEHQGLTPDCEGEVLVTGAAGGVGSVAVGLLSNLGYRVAASTGRPETHDYLKDLGAHSIVPRSELEAAPKGPLGAERWAGCIDNVGGQILANVLASMRYYASVAAVGLAAGAQVTTTVIPFLLRGVNLLGIDSGMRPLDQRNKAWARLGAELPKARLDAMTSEATLTDVAGLADDILAGRVRGRTVIDVRQ
jgi:acrylyl-CoA reductase (NADPH)